MLITLHLHRVLTIVNTLYILRKYTLSYADHTTYAQGVLTIVNTSYIVRKCTHCYADHTTYAQGVLTILTLHIRFLNVLWVMVITLHMHRVY